VSTSIGSQVKTATLSLLVFFTSISAGYVLLAKGLDLTTDPMAKSGGLSSGTVHLHGWILVSVGGLAILSAVASVGLAIDVIVRRKGIAHVGLWVALGVGMASTVVACSSF